MLDLLHDEVQKLHLPANHFLCQWVHDVVRKNWRFQPAPGAAGHITKSQKNDGVHARVLNSASIESVIIETLPEQLGRPGSVCSRMVEGMRRVYRLHVHQAVESQGRRPRTDQRI